MHRRGSPRRDSGISTWQRACVRGCSLSCHARNDYFDTVLQCPRTYSRCRNERNGSERPRDFSGIRKCDRVWRSDVSRRFTGANSIDRPCPIRSACNESGNARVRYGGSRPATRKTGFSKRNPPRRIASRGDRGECDFRMKDETAKGQLLSQDFIG